MNWMRILSSILVVSFVFTVYRIIDSLVELWLAGELPSSEE